jgi:hypothetical protein
MSLKAGIMKRKAVKISHTKFGLGDKWKTPNYGFT